MEEWRDVPGWEGFYQVSSEGRVRSVDRVINALDCKGRPCKRRWKGKILAPGGCKNGYAVVSFTRPGEPRFCTYVHHLVARAFLGPVPEGKEVCHNDGVRRNNRRENIRYGSRSANALDRHIHGTMNQARGESHYFAKLDAEKVRWLRANHHVISIREMAERLGVSHSTADNAIHRKSWRHVD